jgi:hypothetical protein
LAFAVDRSKDRNDSSKHLLVDASLIPFHR